MKLITDTQELSTACNEGRKEPFVTVDTEFMRESTFWPELCLIQFATTDDVFLVDALADGLDLSPFYGLLADTDVTKVFHAARQDVEIFFMLSGAIPTPLFDTQVAAMACGMGDSVGYDTLIKKLVGKSIDKSFRVSNWSARPLSDRQLRYAAQDVSFLRDAYIHLTEELKRLDRSHWLAEEMEILTNPASYQTEPNDAWQRLKLRPSVRKNFGVLVEVAAWREREAKTRNVPRGRVLKDDALYDIVGQSPKSVAAFEKMRFLPKGFSKSGAARKLIEAIERGRDTPPEDLPQLPELRHTSPASGPVIDMLKVLLKLQCERHQVAQKLVATVSDLEKIASGNGDGVAALSGWRHEVFGEAALSLLAGKTGFVIDQGEVSLKEL